MQFVVWSILTNKIISTIIVGFIFASRINNNSVRRTMFYTARKLMPVMGLMLAGLTKLRVMIKMRTQRRNTEISR